MPTFFIARLLARAFALADLSFSRCNQRDVDEDPHRRAYSRKYSSQHILRTSKLSSLFTNSKSVMFMRRRESNVCMVDEEFNSQRAEAQSKLCLRGETL